MELLRLATCFLKCQRRTLVFFISLTVFTYLLLSNLPRQYESTTANGYIPPSAAYHAELGDAEFTSRYSFDSRLRFYSPAAGRHDFTGLPANISHSKTLQTVNPVKGSSSRATESPSSEQSPEHRTNSSKNSEDHQLIKHDSEDQELQKPGIYGHQKNSPSTNHTRNTQLPATPVSVKSNHTRAATSPSKPIKSIGLVHWKKGSPADFHRFDENFSEMSPELCGGLQCSVKYWDDHGLRFGTSSDLNVFFSHDLQESVPKRAHDQLWLLLAYEPQRTITGRKLEKWNGVFNYSSTYERHSNGDKYALSFRTLFRKRKILAYRNFAKERLKITNSTEVKALWNVSNCDVGGLYAVQSGRTKYGLELSKYIKVEALTRKNGCRKPLKSLILPQPSEQDHKKYPFYLAFENSLCKDYITEKIWKILTQDTYTIPVVMGGTSFEEYERITPPNSYIHVKNFTSPQHLAQHLKYVLENEHAFNYYHQWRNEYEFYETDLGNSLHKSELAKGFTPGEWRIARLFCYFCRLAHERPPSVWKNFTSEFSSKDCIAIRSVQEHRNYYNLTHF